MADIHVSTFGQLLTALSGTDDVYLDSDINAQSEGYNTVSDFTIKCNLYGQGHTISNVLIIDKKELITIVGESNLTVKDVYFKNFGIKYSSSVNCIQASESHVYSFSNCKFSILLSSSKSQSYISGTSGSAILSFNECAFDFTVYGASNLMFNGSYNRCNTVIRKGQFSATQALSLPKSVMSSWVFFECSFRQSINLNASGSSNSYLALKDCTLAEGVTNIQITGATSISSLLCCVASSDFTHTTSNIIEVTESQLQSESYLQSIGFLP